VGLPWWVWIILGLWCGPGVHCTFAFLVQKPLPGLTEEGEPIKPLPLRVKIMLFSFLLVVLIAAWPLALWEEINESRLLVKIMMFPIQVGVVVAIWPLLLWREVREGRR
jgi:hypothetical protein